MRKILKIAKLEWSVLVYSPVVWLVVPIFFILCGISFLGELQNFRTSLTMSSAQRYPITMPLFGLPEGLFVSIQQTLYLYLPILTMGLMSRETQSGSIKLLLSSPVKLRQIVLGKYLAILGLALVFIAILGFYSLIGVLSIQHADIGLLASGLLGLFLLLAAYAAIGLFMSCLTQYQIVAAITTLAVFAALRYVGSVGQSIDLVREFTYFLSISGRVETMISGLISTKDCFYYLIIIGLFLMFSVLHLKNQRELKSWKIKIGRYVGLMIVALTLGYLSSLPSLTGYLDLTAGKTMTITKSGQQIAKKVTDKLKITTYVNMFAPNMFQFLPAMRKADLSLQDMYARFIPQIENEYVYYYHPLLDTNLAYYNWNPNFKGIKNSDELAEKIALTGGFDGKEFIGPAQIDKQIDLSGEEYLNVRRLQYQGKSTFLRFYTNDDRSPYPFEPEWMAALKNLMGERMKITFLTGHNETGITGKDDRGYRELLFNRQRRKAMINQGFEIDTVDFRKQEIPKGTNILVVADPTTPFATEDIEKLNAFINQGGNLLFTTNPGRQSVVNPVLSTLGVQVKEGMLVSPDKNLAHDKVNALYSMTAQDMDPNVGQFIAAKMGVVFQGASALVSTSTGPFQVKALLESPEEGWNKMKPLDINAPKLLFNAGDGDEKGSFPIALSLQRTLNGKDQRIMVIGDADYLSNVEFNKSTAFARELQLSADILFRWLAYGKFPVEEMRLNPKDTDLRVSREQISAMGIICKFILPLIILITGAVILFKRRRN